MSQKVQFILAVVILLIIHFIFPKFNIYMVIGVLIGTLIGCGLRNK